MWEVLSFADKPYKGLSKAKVVLVMIVMMVVMISLTRDLSNAKLITMIIIVMVMLTGKKKVKERLKTSNYMMEPPTNYLRHNKKSWTAAYQVVMMMVISSRR